MATKTYIHPFSYGETNIMPLDFKTHSVRKRLPGWRMCQDPKPPFITFGEKGWNCYKCVGEKYFQLPVDVSDSFQFQFQFDDSVNEDPLIPIFGWQTSGGEGLYYISAQILDCNCDPIMDGENEVLGFVDEFASDYGVVFDAVGGSFQWMNVDIGLLPTDLCCFYIQVKSYGVVDDVPTELQIVTAGPFSRIDCGLCKKEDTLLICGSYKKADCWGRRYNIEFGETESTFTDCIRIPGAVIYLGTSSESTFDGDVEIKTVQKKRYRLDIGGVPPMIAEWISNILASNDVLNIGDYTVSRKNGDTVASFDKSIDNVQMFHGSIEFSIVCEIENFGCK